MDPIMVSNERPGFVPFSASPIAISGHRSVHRPSTFRPESFRPMGLIRPVMAQAALPPTPADLPGNLSDEELVRLAARLMIESGQKVEATLKRTADANTSYGGTMALVEAAAALSLGPATFALDAWWQTSRTHQALGQLTGARRLGQQWVNSMQDVWLPGFMERIDKLDRNLGDKVSAQFDLVVVQMGRITDLMRETTELPAYVVSNAVGKFFGSLKNDLASTATALYKILDALGRLVREAGSALATFPTVAVFVGLAALIYFTVK